MTDREKLHEQLDSLECRLHALAEKARRLGRPGLERRMREKEAWCRRKKALIRLDEALPPKWVYLAIPVGAMVLVATLLYALTHLL